MYDWEKEDVIQVDIKDEMQQSFLDYSMSVIVSRALPDVRDGLKPVHRRILYTMYENGLTPEKAYRKCADTVGSVLGRYHPHSDASVYDALVRLAQDFSLRYPLVDGHGNFGSVDGDPAAAYRYTEARMSKISTTLLTDIEKETVDYASNYDDRLQEPKVLPASFPNLLVNGSMGIAVGMATNIQPHNLTEVINGVMQIIDKPETTLEELMVHIKGPDFPTGGMIMGYSGIKSAYRTGRGRIILRGRAEIVENEKTGRFQIIITELPYNVNKSRLVEHIANLVRDKVIDGITNIADHSDRNGMTVLIDIRRDANAQVILNQLYRFTQLQTTEGANMLALHEGRPKLMHLRQMLDYYIEFQIEIVTRRTIFDLRKAKERAHILDGLVIAQDNIDEVIRIFRGSKTTSEAKERLMERFNLSEDQSTAIAQMTLSRLTGLEREKLLSELEELKALIAGYEELLADERKILDVVKEELVQIREVYGDERRTEIQLVSGEVDIEDLIPEEDCVITLTHYGYLKRQAMDVYRTQRRGGRGISGMSQRDDDFVEELFVTSTHDYVMFFTDRGRVFRLKAYEIAESSRASRGVNYVNLLQTEPDEKITAVIRVSEFEENAYLVMITQQGVIKRTSLAAYENVRKSGLIAINLDQDDELSGVAVTYGNEDLIVATKHGMAIRFNEEDVRAVGRTARGVRAIVLDAELGDKVVGFAVAHEGSKLLTVSELGQGRRTELSQYRRQNRGGKGVTNLNIEKHGKVAGVKMVQDDDDVIMISSTGIIIRIPADQIATQSRYGGGVRVMRINQEDDYVVTLARSPKEEEPEEIEDTEETQEQEDIHATDNEDGFDDESSDQNLDQELELETDEEEE